MRSPRTLSLSTHENTSKNDEKMQPHHSSHFSEPWPLLLFVCLVEWAVLYNTPLELREMDGYKRDMSESKSSLFKSASCWEPREETEKKRKREREAHLCRSPQLQYLRAHISRCTPGFYFLFCDVFLLPTQSLRPYILVVLFSLFQISYPGLAVQHHSVLCQLWKTTTGITFHWCVRIIITSFRVWFDPIESVWQTTYTCI